MTTQPIIIPFYKNLRVTDNPALHTALMQNCPIIPLYIHSPEKIKLLGSASKWWLHQSLHTLDTQLKKLGSKLIIRKGDLFEVLLELSLETGAKSIYWSYELDNYKKEEELINKLKDASLEIKTFNALLLFDPWEIKSKQDKPFQLFTPFWKTLTQKEKSALPLPAPISLPKIPSHLSSETLASLSLEPLKEWTKGLKSAWNPGEESALIRLNHFIKNNLEHYATARDRPDLDGSSRLSPHIHFGELSIRFIWNEVKKWMAEQNEPEALLSAEVFLKELGWREFSYHLFYFFPKTKHAPLNPRFEAFPWQNIPALFDAWSSGKTGYPIVDAGMRELWLTGWMHNRVRMIVASFLVKDLLIPWQKGADWFLDTLVDADFASNTMNWQWSAGCGADAAPFFRIFNPMIQGEKFDPEGDYIRKWIPELAHLDNHYIHKPWLAGDLELQRAGITLGESYPLPIVDHSKARVQALKAFHKITKKNPSKIKKIA